MSRLAVFDLGVGGQPTWDRRFSVSVVDRREVYGGNDVRNRVRSVIATIAICAIAASGTHGSDADASTSNGHAHAGSSTVEEVRIAQESFGGETWDPSTVNSTISRYDGAMFETLYRHTPPDAEVEPFLVDHDEVSDDNLVWTLTLKEGITFSNGEELTADDIKFSLDRFRSPESTSPQASRFREAIEDVRVVDELVVEIHLHAPWPELRTALTNLTGNEGKVLPKDHIEAVGWDGFNQQPIGSGPYRMVEHNLSDSIIYEAVDDYWRGTPPFKRITLLLVPEEEARIAMLQSGEVDLIDISPERLASLDGDDLNPLVIPNATTWMVAFLGSDTPSSDVPTSNPDVRKALDLATDKEGILEAIQAGFGSVPPYAPTAPGAVGTPEGLEALPYDEDQARELLEGAGFADGFDIDLHAPSQPDCGQEDVRRVGETLVDAWSRIGVTARLLPVEYSAFRPTFIPDLSPDLIGDAVIFCPRQSPLATRDLSIWLYGDGSVKLTSVADGDIAAALEASTLEEQAAATEAAYETIYEAHVVIPLMNAAKVYAANGILAERIPELPYELCLLCWLGPESEAG